MAENPNFLPEGDNSWLSELMGNFGEDTPSPQEESPLPDISLKDIPPEQQSRIFLAQEFLLANYPNRKLNPPDNLDLEAIKMMRLLADFVKHGVVQVNDEQPFRIEERYPDINVRHAYMAAKLSLQFALEEIQKTAPGTAENSLLSAKHSFFSVLTQISGKAVELEDRRKMHEQDNL
ncbi:MAG: hypothetical protein Q7T54_06005 [Candidatus Levybacteria bacterium]|nr:hypothetical protein [Candidatus Levybacteria bacterium]